VGLEGGRFDPCFVHIHEGDWQSNMSRDESDRNARDNSNDIPSTDGTSK